MSDRSTKPTIASGVKVFGSAVLRIAPDAASIVVAVSRLEKQPAAAFKSAREGALAVNACLHQAQIKDFGSSRVTLSQERSYEGGAYRQKGYLARIEFNVLLREMDKVEPVLTELIAAGANDLRSVTFQSTRLRELRADARRRAIAAAREKAELYCSAAGVGVGPVLAIEDVNPDAVEGRSEGHTIREPSLPDDAGDATAIDPCAIAVTAAVYVVYQIAEGAG